jgi:hypothetical protein
METDSRSVNRVVVALLDGTRAKGFIYGFRAGEKLFTLFPTEKQDRAYARFVPVGDCKAIFFVRSHAGDREAREKMRKVPLDERDLKIRGQRMRIVFLDGEELLARSEAYSPDRLGFFAYPLDARSNNVRIFVVNASVRQVETALARPGLTGGAPVQDRMARVVPTAGSPAATAAAAEAASAAAAKVPAGALSIEARAEAVLRLIAGESGGDLSDEFGVPEVVLDHWARVFVLHGKAGLSHAANAKGDAKDQEIAALRSRVLSLEAEAARRGREGDRGRPRG